MSSKPSRGVETENIHSLLEQLAYFVDELEAQLPFISRIPSSNLTAAPHAGAPSIRSYYEQFLTREEELVRQLATSFKDGQPPTVETESAVHELPIEGVIQKIVGLRHQTLNVLQRLGIGDWSKLMNVGTERKSLRLWLYETVLKESDELREIGVLFSEQQLSFSNPD